MNTEKPTRWPEAALLKEARLRTKKIHSTNSRRVQRMLHGLLTEAGWTDEEFLDAFVRDVTRAAMLRKASPVSGEADLLRKLA